MKCPRCGSADSTPINDYTIDLAPFGIVRYRRRRCNQCGRVFIFKGRVDTAETHGNQGTDERGDQEKPSSARPKTDRASRKRSRKS